MIKFGGKRKKDAGRYLVRSMPSGPNMETVRCMEKDKIIVSNKAMKMKLPCLREIFSILVLFTRPQVSSEGLMILWDGWQLSVICPYSLHIGWCFLYLLSSIEHKSGERNECYRSRSGTDFR